MIFIRCQTPEFAQMLAEQIQHVLGQDVRTGGAADPLPQGATLLDGDALLARTPLKLQAILAEIAGLPREFQWGDTQFFPAKRQISCGGRMQELTELETRFLSVVAEAGKAGVPRAALLRALWGVAEDSQTHTLDTHIYRLRQKLRELESPLILSATQQGYLLQYE